ncbi:MAG: preprotein translocase subunit SecG [Bacteroidia bacterium]
MYTLVTVLLIIASILMVLAILVQSSKGGGLAAGFSGSSQVMGVRKTTEFIEKFTWGCAITLIVLCVVGTFVLPKTGTTKEKASAIQEQIDNSTVPNQQAPQLPPGGNQPAQQPAQ